MLLKRKPTQARAFAISGHPSLSTKNHVASKLNVRNHQDRPAVMQSTLLKVKNVKESGMARPSVSSLAEVKYASDSVWERLNAGDDYVEVADATIVPRKSLGPPQRRLTAKLPSAQGRFAEAPVPQKNPVRHVFL
jgi:hypothetical protein